MVPCEFTMTKFDSYRETEQSWYSSPFYSHYGGYKLCIRLDANGDGRGKGTHISLYVSLMKESTMTDCHGRSKARSR